MKYKDAWKWHDAESEDLPPIDEEVIAITKFYMICFAHRLNPNGFDAKSIISRERKHYDVITYGRGNWNLPDIKWWMPCPQIPKDI